MTAPERLNRFLARQPILNRERDLFAYEILSRYGPENYCRPKAGSSASVNAMDELFLMGIRTMTDGQPAFLNCTREFLTQEYLTLLPRELVVGEILETVAPDEEVVAACHRMKALGYRLALDDYCHAPEMRPLLEFADFVKIDILLMSFPDQQRVVEQCRGLGIPTIAEKVETDQQFQICRELGYDYFQGYFFCRPQVVGRRSVPANKTVYLELLQAANEPLFNLQKISLLFKRDVSLSYRLLRYLNSAAFAFHTEIHSIPHALSLLGEKAMRKWISLVSIAALGDEVADSLLRLPLTRAMFCELIGRRAGLTRDLNELFLLGLLSVMDALLNLPMAAVLKDIKVDDEIARALQGKDSRYRPIFEVVLDYESGTWEQLAESCRSIGLHENFLPDLYLRSVGWASEILAEVPVSA
ncbi:MAG TPA: EAL domain-containing protein [Candidatus Eisenbacteria bacterium]|nr:EAL domain-containing protein [Candidatus Eisenbacteria bacterium]